MSKPAVLAHAITLVGGVAYFLCGLAAMYAPDLYFGFLKYWIHSFNLELVKSSAPVTLGMLLVGLILMSMYTWLFVFITASVYNMLAKKK